MKKTANGYCDMCQRRTCEDCDQCDCDGYPCEHKLLLGALDPGAPRFTANTGPAQYVNAVAFGTQTTQNVVPLVSWTKQEVEEFVSKYPTYCYQLLHEGGYDVRLFQGVPVPTPDYAKPKPPEPHPGWLERWSRLMKI